ncbi:MAG: single-stranded-DNA-specific exonuclease RecJ [Sedimentibacter sp.]|uniref:single-stranded-DNA-specific exonuclease RecJ n=1 Tax=Sedimentibacter sp. TaxID=1960295 RepID=UPI00298243D0|nr:single-stranded-DNA-specific exonuclease RecJ [Sedimentibacter sp.]MDW5299911.1 single-stranded-DNA-specific exonuclease RecJ [Sedimentibacter sp.]
MKKVKLKVNEYEQVEIDKIVNTFNLSEISSRILLKRNISTFEEIKEFLDPDFKYFESAENYKDLQKGCNRILEAIHNKEQILIYGDYDVDGITSISQFVILLSKAGANVDYYVPERENEGYGISCDFIESLRNNEIIADLLITVDCGIAEVEKIREITSFNKDVIVLDHHQCKDEIPPAYAIINPKQKDCPSKNKQLCAAGLSFKFLKHLNRYLKINNIEDVLLELACLGTIADIVDLIGDNRIIASNGLKKINNTRIIGLKKLMEVSGINNKAIESYHIGFIIAPRINAAGRMDSARKAIKLMLTQDENEAEMLALELEKLNVLRKETEGEIFNEAVNKIETDFLYKKNVIVVYGTDWHEGVLGIVASKLTEKYEKPSVVISVKDGIGKGSARSIESVDIFEAFKESDSYLVKYGGHKLAAGLTVLEKNISIFANELNGYIGNMLLSESIYKEIKLDALLKISDVSFNLYDEINKFEPFGAGNPKPVLAVENVTIKNIRKVGKEGNHISFLLSDDSKDIPVIGFGKINILEKVLARPSTYAVSLSINEYNGKKSIQLVLNNVEEQEKLDYRIDENKIKMLNSMIDKTKSKIIKTDIFMLVDKLNRLYNIKITADEIICILKKSENIQYALKNDILYIKK